MATADITADGSPLTDLTGFQRDILAVLASGQTYGLGVKERLETVYTTEINHGRLYPNLDQLVEMGLVDKGEIDKRTNSFRLTERGRRELQADYVWRSSVVGDE